jgi:ribosomal protein S18 acetylase RimI-like enzyme
MNVIIRKAVIEEAEAIAQFNIAMAWETEKKVLPLETILGGVKALFHKPEAGFYLVAETSQQIVGSLMITTEWSDWRNANFWWIQSVYILPAYRRQGIYRKLYETVKAMAQTQTGVCGFRLYVEKENLPAQQTYTSLGMLPTHYLMFEEECES